MELEEVVHHGQCHGAEQLVVEMMLCVVEPLPDAKDVLTEKCCIILADCYHGILIEGYRATDAVMVGRQLIVEEALVGQKYLHLDVVRYPQIFYLAASGHDEDVARAEADRALVVEEMTVTSEADHVDAIGMSVVWNEVTPVG